MRRVDFIFPSSRALLRSLPLLFVVQNDRIHRHAGLSRSLLRRPPKFHLPNHAEPTPHATVCGLEL